MWSSTNDTARQSVKAKLPVLVIRQHRDYVTEAPLASSSRILSRLSHSGTEKPTYITIKTIQSLNYAESFLQMH